MKLKRAELAKAKRAMTLLSGKKLPIYTTNRLAKIIRKLDEEVDKLEKDRKALIEKHGYINDNGILAAKDESTYNKEYMELMMEEVDLDIDKIDIYELDEVRLSAIELNELIPFLSNT